MEAKESRTTTGDCLFVEYRNLELSAPRPAASVAAARAFPGGHGTRLIHYHGAAHQVLAVAIVDRGLRRGIVVDFHKTEPAGLAREAVTHNGHCVDRNSSVGKEIL